MAGKSVKAKVLNRQPLQGQRGKSRGAFGTVIVNGKEFPVNFGAGNIPLPGAIISGKIVNGKFKVNK